MGFFIAVVLYQFKRQRDQEAARQAARVREEVRERQEERRRRNEFEEKMVTFVDAVLKKL